MGDTLIYGLATVASAMTGFLLMPLYTRALEPREYGVVSVITVTMTLLSIFVVLALDNSAHRWYWDTEDLSERKSTLASWASCQISLAAVVALLVAAAAAPTSRVLVDEPGASTSIRIAAATLPLTAFVTVASNWLRMQRRPAAAVAFAIGITVMNGAAGALLVVVLELGVLGVFLAQFLTAAAGAGVAIALMRDWLNPRRASMSRLREMLLFAGPLIPTAIAFWAINLVDRYFVEAFAGSAELGLYQVGYQVSALIILLVGAFQQAWGPFAFSIRGRSGDQQVYAAVLPVFVWFFGAACLTVTVLAPALLDVLATPAYADAASVVGPLAFSHLLAGMVSVVGLGSTFAKSTAWIGGGVCLGAAANVALNVALVPPYGKEGAAAATLVAWGLVPPVVLWGSQRRHYIPYPRRLTLALLVLPLLLAGATLLSPDMNWSSRLLLLAAYSPTFLLIRRITRTLPSVISMGGSQVAPR